MNNRTAIVFGATGLVGSRLVEELIQNMRYSAIKVFSRRRLGIEHIKVVEHIIEVETVDSYSDIIRGNDVYICIGTTMRQAGSVKRYEEIDRDLPLAIALAAREKGADRIAVVSALGANHMSKNYYNRIKGEMEQSILKIDYTRTVIARPSMLLGKRENFRFLELIGKVLVKTFSFILKGKLRVFRGIDGRDVAIAMVAALAENSDKKIYMSDELKTLSERIKKVNNK